MVNLLDTSTVLWTLSAPERLSQTARAAELLGGRVLPIRASHITALAALPDLHRDPFDRVLIAQAAAEGMPLVTGDRQIGAYPVRVVW